MAGLGCLALCSSFPFRLSCPRDFLCFVASLWHITVGQHFPSILYWGGIFLWWICLKQSQQTWLNEFMEQLWLCYVTWIVCLYRSPIVRVNPVLKNLIPDRGVTHMVFVMAACFARTKRLCNVLCLLSQELRHTCLLILQHLCSRCTLDNTLEPYIHSTVLSLWHTWTTINRV